VGLFDIFTALQPIMVGGVFCPHGHRAQMGRYTPSTEHPSTKLFYQKSPNRVKGILMIYANLYLFAKLFYSKNPCHTAVSGPTQNMTSSQRRPESPWACRARSSPFLWKGVAPSRAPQKSVTFLWVIAGDGVWVNWRIRANTTTLPLPVALPFASEGELCSAKTGALAPVLTTNH